MSEEDTDSQDKVQKAVKKERERLFVKLLKNRVSMASDYRRLKHTGGLLTQSMVFAYSKGLEDAFKLITKEEENAKESKEQV